MSNLVIVAIPDENDRVWKISSEKVPHLTVLFLGDNAGDVTNVAKITDFVEHAANTTLKRFYLPVDRRGVLGPDEADVLFFKKGRYDYKAIRDFRAALLQDNNIKTAYDSAQQFDGPWQPHLTLGYPATPANEDPQDYPFYEVSFNRIAVWTGDYEGTEFLLKDYWDELDDIIDSVPMDVAMSDIVEHHGVKGMKWGVRKAETAVGKLKTAANRASTAAKDQTFEAQTRSNEVGNQLQSNLHKAAHAKLKSEDLPKINAKPEYVKAARLKNRLLNPLDATTRQYRGEVKSAYIGRLEEAANSLKNASGTRQYTIRERGIDLPAEGGNLPKSKYQWEVSTRAVKHATTTPSDTYTLEVVMDANGFITDLIPVANVDNMAQTADLGAEFLSHYGVKGMRWGMHRQTERSTPTPKAPSATSVVPHGDKRKTKIEATGGENHPAHEDAIKVAEAKAKLQKSGVAALSNQELRDVASRVQLEQQVTQLTASKGKKFATNLIKTQGQQELNAQFNVNRQNRLRKTAA